MKLFKRLLVIGLLCFAGWLLCRPMSSRAISPNQFSNAPSITSSSFWWILEFRGGTNYTNFQGSGQQLYDFIMGTGLYSRTVSHFNPPYIRAGFATDADARLRMAGSDDGIHWRCLDTNCSVLYTGVVTVGFGEDVIRDPSIVAYSNRIYLAYTSQVLNALDYFSLAVSTNGLTWAFLANITNTVPHGANAIWAPEWFLDGTYVRIYWSRGDAGNQTGIWETHALNGTLNSWTAASPVLTNGLYIDPSMIRSNGGRYYLFYRDINSNYIHRASSASPTNGFTIDQTGDWAGWGQNLEGPSIIQIATNRWRIYLENFNSYTYRYSESSNLINWTALAELGEQYQLRHGTVMTTWGTNIPHRHAP